MQVQLVEGIFIYELILWLESNSLLTRFIPAKKVSTTYILKSQTYNVWRYWSDVYWWPETGKQDMNQTDGCSSIPNSELLNQGSPK